MLNIALPNGSLEDETLQLFKDAGLEVIREPRQQKARILDHLTSEVTIMRPQSMPSLVEDGQYDVAICGWDCVLESNASIGLVTGLAYSRFTREKVKVVLIGHVDDQTQQASEVEPGSRIFSEYPGYTRRFFEGLSIRVNVEFSHGTTEAHIPHDYRYGVCVSERGVSLSANNLRIIQVLFESATTLIANQQAMNDPEKAKAIHVLKLLLLGAIDGREYVLLMMNVHRDKMDDILKRIPALERPTISDLASNDYVAINAVVSRKKANSVSVELLEHGAEGLIEIPIKKLIRHW